MNATEIARHVLARDLCQRRHGDWRYDPGKRRHIVYYWRAAILLALDKRRKGSRP